MTFLLKTLFSLIRLLHSENGEKSIATGVCIGAVLGFSPLLTPQVLFIIIASLIFRVQFGALILSWLFFSIISLSVSFITEPIGYSLLSMKALKPMWSFLINLPGFHFSNLNNSLVLGGFVFSFFSAPLIFLITKALLKKYRTTIGNQINNSKALKFIKATKLFSIYTTYEKF